MVVETRKWCQPTRLVKPPRKICILAYLGHDLALTGPDLTWDQSLKLVFQGQKVHVSHLLDEANTVVSFSFRISHIWKKNICLKNDNFWFDDLWIQIIDLSLNLIEKQFRGMKRAPHCFFVLFLAIILLEIIAFVFEKSIFYRNLTFSDLWGPQSWPDLKMAF